MPVNREKTEPFKWLMTSACRCSYFFWKHPTISENRLNLINSRDELPTEARLVLFLLFLSYFTEFPGRTSTLLVLPACMNIFWNAYNTCFFSSSSQLFLIFPQILPVLACLEASSSPDCVLAHSNTTSSKLPTSSWFHLLGSPVSQSSPGDVAKWQVFSTLGQQPSLSLLAEKQYWWYQYGRICLYPECSGMSCDFNTAGNLRKNFHQCGNVWFKYG